MKKLCHDKVNIFITGANGFVGKALCEELLSRKFHVRAVVRSAEKQKQLIEKFREIECGVQENFHKTDWLPFLEGIDTIVHLASRVHVMNEQLENPLNEYRRINVNLTEQLAEAAIKAGVKRFVYISSVKVNGEVTTENQKFKESDIPCPQDFYAQSKLETEQALQKIAANSDLEIVILRPPLIYGEGVKANFLKLIQTINKGWPLPLGAIHNQRSLIYVKNFADAIIACIQNEKAKGQIYLVSDNEDVSTPELIQKLAVAMNKPARLISIKPSWLKFVGKITGKQEAVQRLLSSLQIETSKIRDELGWIPAYTMEEAFRHSFAYSS